MTKDIEQVRREFEEYWELKKHPMSEGFGDDEWEPVWRGWLAHEDFTMSNKDMFYMSVAGARIVFKILGDALASRPVGDDLAPTGEGLSPVECPNKAFGRVCGGMLARQTRPPQESQPAQDAQSTHIALRLAQAALGEMASCAEPDCRVVQTEYQQEALKAINAALEPTVRPDRTVEAQGSGYWVHGPLTVRPAVEAQDSERLREALTTLLSLIESAGLKNLTNGVQLGATSWHVKMDSAIKYAADALTGASPGK